MASLFALGGGSHVLWLDPNHDLVMVARRVDKRLLARVAGPPLRPSASSAPAARG